MKLNINSKIWIFIILAAGFFIRVLGIDYGLPLWLVGDEVPFVSGTLKMMELKTLIPALHADEFVKILYFPPYICYLYLIPFALVMGIKFLFFSGNFLEFRQFLIYDTSILFLTARIISVFFGTATIYLVYRAARNLFSSELAALFSAAFLSFSLLHINFSHWTRHWVFVVFFFALIIFILSKAEISIKKRYLYSMLIVGLGFGVNYQMLLVPVFILGWLLFYEKMPLGEIIKTNWIYKGFALFLALSVLAVLLYPSALMNHGNTALETQRSILGFFSGYFFYFFGFLRTEPGFFMFIALGMIFSFLSKRRFLLVTLFFSAFYIAFFYCFYLLEGRYIILLYPLLALVAGYGLFSVTERFKNFRTIVLSLVILGAGLMIFGAVKFDLLLVKNDTRIQATKWLEQNVVPGAKIAVLARLTRISGTPESITEQENIDSASLRQVDFAEKEISGKFIVRPRYHVLNLYAVKSQEFLSVISDYLREKNYEYLIYSPEFAEMRGIGKTLDSIGEKIYEIPGFENNDYDITNGFEGGLKNIFSLKNSGPTIVIKKL